MERKLLMKKPLISVIVPVYNTEKYVEKCIRSISSQTYDNIEIIIVDDGSTDSSGQICDRLAAVDSRIKVFHRENGGQASARNFALSVSRGDYIGYVDSDDWIAEDMYGEMLGTLIDTDSDVCVCGRFSVIDGEIKRSESFNMSEVTVMEPIEAIRRFLIYDVMDSSAWDKLFKRSVVENLEFPSGYICEDIPFVFNSLLNSSRIVHCAKPFYYCLHRAGSTSRATFSQKGMGLYIYPLEVYNSCLERFPSLHSEAEYYYLKNLLVTALRISAVKGKVEQRKYINRIVRKNIFKILKCGRLKKSYKLFALFIFFHIERIANRVGKALGIRKAGL